MLRGVILGPPGSGKGTILSRLVKHYNGKITTISSGDLLRAKISNEPSSEIAKIVANGNLVPDKLMINLIGQRLGEESHEKSWILDGFPRTQTQAKSLDASLEIKQSPLNLVIHLDVPFDVILNRIENRWIHQPSGRVYNLQYNPPNSPGLDDITGDPLVKRPDDNVEVFSKRLDVYSRILADLKGCYEDKGILKTIKGSTSDVTYPQLLEIVGKTIEGGK